MKESLNPKVVAIALVVVVAIILGVVLAASGSFAGGGPALTPRKFTPPAGYRGPNQGGPIGAPGPAQPGGK